MKYPVPVADYVVEAIVKVINEPIPPAWIRHVIQWGGDCGCVLDVADYMDTCIVGCELWETTMGDEVKFKDRYGVSFAERQEREKQERAERERTIAAARQRVLEERDEKWGHLLP